MEHRANNTEKKGGHLSWDNPPKEKKTSGTKSKKKNPNAGATKT